MGEYEKFQKAILDTIKPKLEAVIHEREPISRKIYAQLIGDEILYKAASSEVEEDVIIDKIFFPFSQFANSQNKLSVIYRFIQKGYLKKVGVTYEEYLRYHVENYLNSIYVFIQRFKRLITSLYRCKDPITYNGKIKAINRAIEKAFEGIIKLRDRHIHQEEYDDFELKRIGLLNTLVQAPPDGDSRLFSDLYKSAFLNYRKQWIQKVKLNQKIISSIIDSVFNVVNNDFVRDGIIQL